MAVLLFFTGLLAVGIGSLWFIIAWFSVSILWGLACLFIPFVSFVFVFVHWEKARMPILVQMVGILLMVSAFFVGGECYTREFSASFRQYISQNFPEQYKQLGQLPSGDLLPSIKDFSGSGDNLPLEQDKQEGSEAEPAPKPGQKRIYKCVDANGRVTYSEQACEKQEVKTINISTTL